jgi:hypothetical protein
MGATPRVHADIQGAPPKQTHAASVASMEAIHGLCVCIQDAPPKHKHAVSVSSMEAMGCANIQVAPPTHKHAGSVASMGGTTHGLCADIQGAPPK